MVIHFVVKASFFLE